MYWPYQVKSSNWLKKIKKKLKACKLVQLSVSSYLSTEYQIFFIDFNKKSLLLSFILLPLQSAFEKRHSS